MLSSKLLPIVSILAAVLGAGLSPVVEPGKIIVHFSTILTLLGGKFYAPDPQLIQSYAVTIKCRGIGGEMRGSSGTLVKHDGAYYVTTLAHFVLSFDSSSGESVVGSDFVLESLDAGTLTWTKLLYDSLYKFNNHEACREAALFCVEPNVQLRESAPTFCTDDALGKTLSAVATTKGRIRFVKGLVIEVTNNKADELHYFISDKTSALGRGSGSGMFWGSRVVGVIQGSRSSTYADEAGRAASYSTRSHGEAFIAGLIDLTHSSESLTRVIAAKEFVKLIDGITIGSSNHTICEHINSATLSVEKSPSGPTAVIMSSQRTMLSTTVLPPVKSAYDELFASVEEFD